jgi:hypothetical protein
MSPEPFHEESGVSVHNDIWAYGMTISVTQVSGVGKTREAVSGLTALPVAGTPDKAGIRGLSG